MSALVRFLPAPVFHAARLLRSAGFWLLGPADFFRRVVTGRRNLPPLWLRRHAGPPNRFESAAREMAELLERLCLVEPDDCVLDIGCGAGAMVRAFARWLGPRGRYVGVDIHGPSIRWCRRKFGRDPRFWFERVDHSRRSRLPVRDAEAGFVLAKSLFTHLLEEDARRLLAEVRRTLAPGRAALITAFLFERGEGERLCADYFPLTGGSGSVRWRWKARPESAVAVERPRFLQWVAQAGLDVERFIPGFWPGAAEPGGQDVIVLSYGTARRTALPCSRNRVAPKTP